tara:strand:+ start:11927 stop:12166 length:240 start_codon:yes stop_codon:yes gene_type:complete
MKKHISHEWKIISTSNFSSKNNLLNYKEWETNENENKLFIKKDYTRENLTNEWKIIMNSKYPCKTVYIVDYLDNDALEF